MKNVVRHSLSPCNLKIYRNFCYWVAPQIIVVFLVDKIICRFAAYSCKRGNFMETKKLRHRLRMSPPLQLSQKLVFKNKIAIEPAGIHGASQSNPTDGFSRSKMFKLPLETRNCKILISFCSSFIFLQTERSKSL